LLRNLFPLLGNLLALVAAVGLLARFVPPDVWWPPTVIALLLPGLLLLTALFMLVLLYRKLWRAAILPGLIMLASLSVVGQLFAFGGGTVPTAEPSARLIVVTNNAMGFKGNDGKVVDEATVDKLLKSLGPPDVLLLQEAGPGQGNVSRRVAVMAAGKFAAHLQPQGKTVAIYGSALKLIGSEFTTYNGFSVVDMTTRLGTVRFINAHLESNGISGMASKIGEDKELKQELDLAESMFRSYGRTARTRATQADKIRRYVEESPYPVIVGGDFNDVPSSYTYQRVLTPRLRDAWVAGGLGLGTTFTGPLPGLRIDFLMIDTSLNIVEVTRFDTGFSDHRGLRVVVSK